MVAAARKVVPVLVDCSEKGAQSELMTKYGVSGFPTVVYVDPDGKKLKEMATRDAKPLVGEIDGVAAKFPGQPSLFQNSVTGAIALAKTAKAPLPVVVYVAEEKADLLRLAVKLGKDLASKRAKFVFVVEVGRKPLLEARALESAPVALVLDPTAEKPDAEPLAKIAIAADEKPAVLGKALDEAAKKMKKK